MGFDTGNQWGKVSKRGQSKMSIAIREVLEGIFDKLIKSIDFDGLTNNQKMHYLRVVLPYIVPKQKHIEIDNKTEPPQNFTVEIIDKSGDVDKAKEHFESLDNNDLLLAKDLNDIFED